MHQTPKMVTTLAGLFLNIVGFGLFYLFQEFILTAYNLQWKLTVSPRVQFDLYGAVIPGVISVLTVLYLFRSQIFSVPHFIYCFLLSSCFAILIFRRQGNAIVGPYFLLVLSVSFLSVITVFSGGLPTMIGLQQLEKFQFSKRSYVTSLLMTVGLAPLSALTVDLTYALFVPSIYIGARGLRDGIMLILLSTPLGVTFATLFVVLVHEMYIDIPSGEPH